MKIYAVYDKAAKRFISTTMSETDDSFVRSALYPLLMDYPLNDVEYYCVGDFDADLGVIKPCKPRLCSWEVYKFPTSRTEKEKYLTLEEIDKAAKEKKHEFLQENKDKIEDAERLLSTAKGQLELEEKKDKKDRKRIRELRAYIKQISNEIKSLKEIA